MYEAGEVKVQEFERNQMTGELISKGLSKGISLKGFLRKVYYINSLCGPDTILLFYTESKMKLQD